MNNLSEFQILKLFFQLHPSPEENSYVFDIISL